MVGVCGSFDVPFRHFAFDDTRVGAVPSGRVEAMGEQDQGVCPATVGGDCDGILCTVSLLYGGDILIPVGERRCFPVQHEVKAPIVQVDTSRT